MKNCINIKTTPGNQRTDISLNQVQRRFPELNQVGELVKQALGYGSQFQAGTDYPSYLT
jgi:hypothetical protein